MSAEDGKQVSQTSTKVYYYLDETTPFVSIVPVAPDKITLGDFKKVFERQGFKYFCKEFDPVFQKEVKVELFSDSQKLNKSENGVIQLVLLPIYKDDGNSNTVKNLIQAGGTLPRTTKSFGGLNDSFQLKKRRSAQALSSIADDNDFGIHRVSMVTDPSTMTYFSRRAGEHLAEDDYSSSLNEDNDELEDTGSHNSSYKQLTDSDRGPNGGKRTKAYVPSTISSVTASSHSNSLPRVDEIKISMKDAPCLGIQVVDHDGGIFIGKIKSGSAADICGLLEIGDQIIQINNCSFEFLTIQQAIVELQKVAKSKKTITMFVAKRPRISDEKSEGGLSSVLCDTMPLDVSNWVEATTEAERPKPFRDLEISNNNGTEDDTGAITSDEERAAYIDRRNGIGACLVPALHNFRNNNPIESSSNNNQGLSRKENDENDMLNAKLTVDTDPTWILRRMVHPNSGLEIANRKWLKIPFPNSFIGNDMLNWLLQNVSGFNNKKHAQNYAGMLLSKGFIHHVLDAKAFDKKRYYFFDEPIIAYRRQIEIQLKQQATGSPRKPVPLTAATTEVTYLGSPTYPQINSKNQLKSMPASCGILPGPSGAISFATQNTYLTGIRAPGRNNPQAVQSQPILPSRFPTTNIRSPYYPGPTLSPGNWPISPIYPYQNERNRNCGSPQTNDYASMIQGEINSNYASVPVNPQLANFPFLNGGGKLKSASPPPNTPNTLSANSSTALLPVPKIHHRS